MLEPKTVFSSVRRWDVSVTANGKALTVALDNVTVDGTKVTVPPHTYTVTSATDTINVCGYLVRTKSNGEISIVVDEWASGATATPIHDSGPAEVLEPLFWFVWPPTAKSFEDVVVTYLILSPPKSVSERTGQ